MDRPSNIDGVRHRNYDNLHINRPVSEKPVSQKSLSPLPLRFSKKLLALSIASLIIVVVLATVGVWWWIQKHQLKTLLPTAISQQVDFEPYFFMGSVPNGYTFKSTEVIYSNGLLSVRLTKAGSADITISQQALPSQLKQTDVLGGPNKIDTAIGRATVNDVDGHMLGSVISNDIKPTLILVTSSSSASQNDLIAIIKSLSKVR